jgi:methylthioribulose-1-phosphate dehydratase
MSDAAGQKKSAEPPGAGWTNGDLPPAMRVVGQQNNNDQQLVRFGERRWISPLSGQGWTRIGDGHEHDAVSSSSKTIGDDQFKTVDPVAIKCLIAQLCEFFYRQGWATGTGGGCSIRVRGDGGGKGGGGGEANGEDGGGTGGAWRVFVAPSGIQKEDMIWQDIFELDMDRNVVVPPVTPGLRQSACTPLWYVVYQHRPHVTCVIHTHSMAAVQATLIDESATSLDLTHLEMLKGVGGHAYDDLLQIPIIDNRPTEDLLADQLEAAVIAYPKCNAALVRRHGTFLVVVVVAVAFLSPSAAVSSSANDPPDFLTLYIYIYR